MVQMYCMHKAAMLFVVQFSVVMLGSQFLLQSEISNCILCTAIQVTCAFCFVSMRCIVV